MKKALLTLLLLASAAGFSQKTWFERDPKDRVDYSMELQNPRGSVTVSNYKSAEFTGKALILRNAEATCERASGITLTFADGSALQFNDAQVLCLQGTRSTELTGVLPMTDALLRKISKTEIASFTLGKAKTVVHFKEPGENLIALVKLSSEDDAGH